MSNLALRRDQLTKFRRIAKGGLEVDATFAERIGVNPGQLSRVLSGKSGPGTKFIAGTLEIFGIECFSDLFSIVPNDDEDAA